MVRDLFYQDYQKYLRARQHKFEQNENRLFRGFLSIEDKKKILNRLRMREKIEQNLNKIL